MSTPRPVVSLPVVPPCAEAGRWGSPRGVVWEYVHAATVWEHECGLSVMRPYCGVRTLGGVGTPSDTHLGGATAG